MQTTQQQNKYAIVYGKNAIVRSHWLENATRSKGEEPELKETRTRQKGEAIANKKSNQITKPANTHKNEKYKKKKKITKSAVAERIHSTILRVASFQCNLFNSHRLK